jgi:ADP-heptose:LPS heptosyltransferase
MLRRIGDVTLTIPAARALRTRFPEARIDFLTEPPCEEVLAGVHELSNILVYRKGWLNYLYWFWRLRSMRYDWVVDYMGNPRSAMLTFFSRASLRAGPARASHAWAYTHRLAQPGETLYNPLEKIRMLSALDVDFDETDPMPRIASSADAEEFAQKAFLRMRMPKAPVVGLAPASRRVTRRWPAESYAALGRLLRDRRGLNVVVCWGPGERGLAERVRETKDLRQAAAVLGRCDVVVTNCNGPRHLATARGVPTLTIHSSSDPASWNPPDQDRFPFVRKEDLHCIGCRKNECPYDMECMNRLAPETVCERALALLDRTRSAAA